MPESAEMVDQLRAAGIAAVISGAGPSVLAIVDRPLDLKAWQHDAFDAAEWAVDGTGATAGLVEVGTSEPAATLSR